MRSGVRHFHRRAGLSQVSESALRPGALAQGQRQPRKLGRLSRRTLEGSEVERLGAEPPGRRLDRAAVPDRHHLRLVPHRVRSAQSAGGPGASAVGEHQGRVGNQYSRMSEILGSGMPGATLEWQMFAHARPGTSTPRRSPTDQVNNPGTINAIINPRAADLRGRSRQQVAQGRDAARKEDADLLVRARPRQQVLATRRGDRDRASHPQGRRRLDRRARGDPARVLQHRLVRRAMLGQPSDRSAPARSAPAQLRPDAVRHRPVPARLSQLPRDRGPAAQHPRVPDVEGNRRDRPAVARATRSRRRIPRQRTRSAI